MKDDGEEYQRSLSKADMLLYISPISAGFITTETKKALDRFITNALPYITIYNKECHHLQRYPEKKPTLGIALLDDGNIDERSINLIFNNFDRIRKNMRSKRKFNFLLNESNIEELYSEIINN